MLKPEEILTKSEKLLQFLKEEHIYSDEQPNDLTDTIIVVRTALAAMGGQRQLVISFQP
jgi:hypothetical protein